MKVTSKGLDHTGAPNHENFSIVVSPVNANRSSCTSAPHPHGNTPGLASLQHSLEGIQIDDALCFSRQALPTVLVRPLTASNAQ